MHALGSDIRVLVVLTTLMMSLCSVRIDAQELRCDVEVNTSKIEGTGKSVFESLEKAISEYLNNTKWTDSQFSPVEKIECRLFLTVNEYRDGKIKGDLQVQLMRPVFNSVYTTTVLNYKDTKVEFDYEEGTPLIYNDKVWRDNLTGILDFYAYMFLALDFDSFSPDGGQKYYDKAASVVQAAQSGGGAGWRMFEDNRNRSALLGAFTDRNTCSLRDLIYKYHRKGLDQMSTSPDKGREEITESLTILGNIYDNSPMSIGLQLMRDAKLEELVGVYSRSPRDERQKIYELLHKIYSADDRVLEKIRRPGEV